MTESIEAEVVHRPWPLPEGPWVMFQSWRELLFAHWRVPVERMRRLVPPQLELDTFDGTAWVGLTPFRLTDLRARYMPALPGISEFPEMNLRTYVRSGEKPGIHFFSLDAGSALAVLGARIAYGLPYFRARMRMESRDGWIHYDSRREHNGGAELVARYRPAGEPFTPQPGTLEHFLIERYALYTVPRGKVIRGDIHHRPWTVRPAAAEIERNTVLVAHGIEPAAGEPLIHYAERQDTLVWPPKLVG